MTQQLDLFGSAPAAAAPPKIDTPMLLAMSDDYALGGPTPEPKAKEKEKPKGPAPDPLGAQLIELGLVPNEFVLNLNSTLSPPHDMELPAPWNLPSRLFQFPIETYEPRWKFDGTLFERTIGIIHPELKAHPFVQQVEQLLEIELTTDATNEHGYNKDGLGQWWHAVDLMSKGLWRELLDTAHFTTPEYIAQAVAFCVRYKGRLSLKDARHVLQLQGDEPAYDLDAWLKLWHAPSPVEKRYPVNDRIGHDDGRALTAWGMLHGIEHGLFKFHGDFIAWSDKGLATYNGERTELL